MRHTEFWARMEAPSAPAYARAWATQSVLAELERPHRRRRRSTPACRPRRSGPPSGGPSSCRRSTDDRIASEPISRRCSATPCACWSSAQAVGAIGITIGIATASLLARDISGSDTQAGLAQTCQVLGAAVASFLLARLMSRRGRRVGPGDRLPPRRRRQRARGRRPASSSRWRCCSSAPRCSARRPQPTTARGTPPPTSPPERRGPARCRPSSGRPTIGAVAGPNLTGLAGWAARPAGLPALTGPFAVGTVGMLAAGVVVIVVCCGPTRCCSRARQPASRGRRRPARRGAARVDVVRERPVLAGGVLGLAGAHAAMVAVMVMTPLHMEHGGAELRDHRRGDQRARARHVRLRAPSSAAPPTGSAGRRC